MSRKATLDALFGAKPLRSEPALETKAAEPTGGVPASGRDLEPGGGESAAVASAGRIRSGAIGAMGASLQQLQDSAREAETLRRSLVNAESIVALDPDLIDSAPIADRFVLENEEAEAALTQSIRDSGQQVPVLVRPHPTQPGRWQAAYGHRRIRACRVLRVPVRAIVRELSDSALAIAQGKENLERRDLSFIERAFFAAGLEGAGFDRNTVMQALGVHKADVSRYISVVAGVPVDLVRIIGPAPKAGRARWMELSERLAADRPGKPSLRDLLEVLPQLGAFQNSDSDQRFQMVLQRLSAGPVAAAPAPSPAPVVQDSSGRVVVTAVSKGRQRQIVVNDAIAPGFADAVSAALPELYRRWLTTAASKTNVSQGD
jgi:ParB family transcriptional regulator, chromosome partitioning protein